MPGRVDEDVLKRRTTERDARNVLGQLRGDLPDQLIGVVGLDTEGIANPLRRETELFLEQTLNSVGGVAVDRGGP